MSYYNSIPNKFNRFLLLILTVSPFIAYLMLTYFGVDFNKLFSVLSYFGVALILIHGNKNNPIKFPTYLWFYLLFVLYVYFSTFFLLDRKFKMIYLTNNFIIAINTLFIIENLSINKKYYDYLFKISRNILGIAVLVILIQQAYDSNFFMNIRSTISLKEMNDATESRLDSIYSWVGEQSVGYCFVPIFLLVVEYFNKKKKKGKVLFWILLGIIFAVLTKARWIMLNTLFVFIMIVVTEKDKIKTIISYSILIPSILLFSYIVLNNVGINAEGIVKNRILESDKKMNNKSASTRLLAISVFNRLYWKNAVFGVGDLKYGMGAAGKHNYELSKALGGKSSQIHVGFLSLFYTYGAIGGLLFMLFTYYILKQMYQDSKKTKLWAPFFGVLGFFLANTTLVYLSFFEFGLIFAVMANKYFVKQVSQELKLS